MQVFVSSKLLDESSEHYMGLKDIYAEPYKNMYRYLYGKTASYDEIQKIKKSCVDQGFTDAYVVAYQKGVRISTRKAIKLTSVE